MNCVFANLTVRSADDLFADLKACRQLRHMSDAERRAVVADYGLNLATPRFVRLSEAFQTALLEHGYSCDICGEVVEPLRERIRYAADRCLDNLDGRVKPMLCQECSGRCERFCRRTFDRDVRVPYSDELEQMFLAWIAYETLCFVKRAA